MYDALSPEGPRYDTLPTVVVENLPGNDTTGFYNPLYSSVDGGT